VGVGAAVAAGTRDETVGSGQVDPLLGREQETVPARLISNSLEFEGIKTAVKGSIKGSPISVLRQTIKRLRPQIFLFRRFSLGPRPVCGGYSILLNRSLNLDLHALAWAIRSVTHLALALFVSRSFAPFSWTRCFRTTSHAQPRFTTGSRKSSVPAGVHSVRRALVRAWPTGLSRPTLCRLTGRSNRRKNFLVRRCSPVASGSHL
jgi:hypothetical protein